MKLKPPKYRLHRPTGQALVEFNGRRYYLGKHGTPESKEAYQRFVHDWAQQQLDPAMETKTRAPLGISINRLILSYYRHAESYYVHRDGTPTGEALGIKYALRPLKELYGHTSATSFGPKALKAVRQRMIELGWCRKLINARINRIRRAFKWAVSEELIPASVFEGLRSVAGLSAGRSEAREKEPVRPVSDEHARGVFPFVSTQVQAIIGLQLLTGMRPGEVIRMRGDSICRQGRVWTYHPERHKTAYCGKSREIYLGPKAQEALKPFLAQKKPEEYLFSPRDAQAEKNANRRLLRKSPMTPSQKARQPKASPKKTPGDHYTVDSYRRAIRYGAQRAGVSPWHPNQLRHTCATDVRREFGLDAAQVILGHQHARTTEIYAEQNRHLGHLVAERFG
ncbi:site-specific integrase [bacterium]|nr:site-specific integrase [bacterium]